MLTTATWLKLVLGIVFGILLIWVGLVGRPGALLAAFIVPGNLQEAR
jgi:hypothetical protein